MKNLILFLVTSIIVFSNITVFAQNKFGANLLPNDFTFTIPNDYNHSKQIKSFIIKNKSSEVNYIHECLTDNNFTHVTNELIQGRTYTVKLFPILREVKSEECLIFLKSNNAILVGAQGLTFLHECHSDKLPIWKYILSFDKKDALYKDTNDNARVPSYCKFPGDIFDLYLGNFELYWDSHHVLLCLCE